MRTVTVFHWKRIADLELITLFLHVFVLGILIDVSGSASKSSARVLEQVCTIGHMELYLGQSLQLIASGGLFLQSQIAIVDLVLLSYFATFRWNTAYHLRFAIEIGWYSKCNRLCTKTLYKRDGAFLFLVLNFVDLTATFSSDFCGWFSQENTH